MSHLRLTSSLPAALLLAALAPPAGAQGLVRPDGPSSSLRAEQTPGELEGVKVDEQLGAMIDLNLEFVGEDGYPHPLSEYFRKGRPVILNLVYYTCPMLCNLVLNAQVAALREVPGTPGNEFEVVTASIDPTENFGLARSKKAAYLASYDRPAPGWHFLSDYKDNVRTLARQVGFGYRLDPKTGQYAHAAAIFVLTPDGKVSRYLYGIKFKPFDIRMALTEASQGKTGSSVDKILLYCFHYDPAEKAYVLFARNVMRLGGVATLLLVGIVLWFLWRREKSAGYNKTLVTVK